MSFKLNTMHIFGYGEVQIIGTDNETPLSKKVNVADVKSVPALVAHLFTFKPKDNASTDEYHVLNIFNEQVAAWMAKGENAEGWRIGWSDLNLSLVDAVVNEVIAL